MKTTTIQIPIPLTVLVDAIKSLKPDDKILIKQVLDEEVAQIPEKATKHMSVQNRDPQKAKQAAEDLRKVTERLLAETGMTEDELVELFDMSKPFPYEISS
jgi:FMN-dependent NADH-azoreductase